MRALSVILSERDSSSWWSSMQETINNDTNKSAHRFPANFGMWLSGERRR